MARRIRRSQGISDPPTVAVGEGDVGQEPELPLPSVQPAPQRPLPIPKTATELFAEPASESAPVQPTEPEPSLQKQKGILASFLAGEISAAMKTVREQFTPRPPVEKQPRDARPQKAASPKIDLAAMGFALELKAAPKPEEDSPPEPPLPPIDPRLFTVPESGGYWPDEAPLIELAENENTHTWTLKHAFEGILILGRTGSGKTSGSGFTFAESFLRNGFGGLILTVKTDEPEHWRRLCARSGRENDLVVVSRGGDWKLNILAYEAQHPGQGAGLSENLTSFCRNLLRISSRSQGKQDGDQIWIDAGDQLRTQPLTSSSLPAAVSRLTDWLILSPLPRLRNCQLLRPTGSKSPLLVVCSLRRKILSPRWRTNAFLTRRAVTGSRNIPDSHRKPEPP